MKANGQDVQRVRAATQLTQSAATAAADAALEPYERPYTPSDAVAMDIALARDGWETANVEVVRRMANDLDRARRVLVAAQLAESPEANSAAKDVVELAFPIRFHSLHGAVKAVIANARDIEIAELCRNSGSRPEREGIVAAYRVEVEAFERGCVESMKHNAERARKEDRRLRERIADQSKQVDDLHRALDAQVVQPIERKVAPMSEPIKLGDLIAKLKRCDQDAQVRFDFCRFVPAVEKIASYRGDYAQLAIDFSTSEKSDPLVSTVLAAFEAALGQEFDGYKGGTYRAHALTEVYVSSWGDWSQTAIVDVVKEGVTVVLATAYAGWC